MAIHSNDPLAPEIRALQLEIAAISKYIKGPGGINEQLATGQRSIQSLLITRADTPPSPVANLLYNGELGHSNNTWFDTTAAGGDKNEECAWWFSHNLPALQEGAPDFNLAFVNSSVNTGTYVISVLTTPHGLTTGMPVDLFSGGILPPALAEGTVYFAIADSANTLRLATTRDNAFAGTPIAISSTSTDGFHEIQQQLLSISKSSGAAPLPPGTASEFNNALKTYAHSEYLPEYSRWDAVNGWAEMTGTMSVDALMPANLIDATTPLARIGIVAAKKNSFIEIPDECLMGAGIWDNTTRNTDTSYSPNGRQFLQGSFPLTGEVVGAGGSTTRAFKALITSDRGYSILSEEFAPGAVCPADGAFTPTNYIAFSWPQQAGQLSVLIYESYNSGAEYRLIADVSAGTSFIYQGDVIDVVAGYPTPTENTLSATFYTLEGELAQLATNGVSAAWDTVIFPIAVPANYNKGVTYDRQWVRLWLTVAPNLYITGVTTDGSTTVTIPDGAVESAALASGGYGTGGSGASKYYGLSVEVYDSAGTAIGSGRTVASVTSDTAIVLSSTVAAGSDRIIRIVGAGFHGVLIDKIHLGYQANTSYTPNNSDIRTLQPRAAPASSSQGGVGSGDGDGEGGISCVATGTPVKMNTNIWKPIQTTRPGQWWASAGLRPNTLIKLTEGMCQVRRVRAENGCEVVCTDTERFVVDDLDMKGTPLARLRVGDSVLTEVDGRIVTSNIVEISPYLGLTHVYTPKLSDNHLFIAGRLKTSFWRQIGAWFTQKPKSMGGFVLHNAKGEYDPLE